jgi:phosphoglycerol transferase MdoB-like AlkP superfamily enzyme
MHLPRHIPVSVRLLFADYLLGLAAFTLLRAGFLLFNHAADDASATENFMALGRGIQFDSVVCGMILLLPFVFLLAGTISKQEIKFRKAAFITTNIFFTLAFFAAFADMPLFLQFGKRLSVAALHWSNSTGFVLKIIFGNAVHLLLIVLFIAFCFLFYRVRKKFSIRIISSFIKTSAAKNFVWMILPGALLLLAVRGRISLKSPIRWGTAYFCTNDFANQTVLNPFYTFLTSVYESSSRDPKEYIVMEDSLAVKIFRENAGKNLSEKISGDENAPKRNVVLVIMESMAGWKTGLYPNGLKWTRALDTLAKKGIFFPDFYSDGIHTFNGLYATLTGMQSLPGIHPLNEMNISSDPVTLAELLKQKNYTTIFFTTHDPEFDNMNGFMRKNGFDEVMGESDYSYSPGMNPMGVPDHILFREAREKMDEISKNGKPFFATLLTGSDHEPFKIPQDIAFIPNGKNAKENAASYADWSIGQFVEACKKEAWYANTIFVFVADHGGIPAGKNNDMYLAFHHIPCIIFGPGISPQINSSIGTQADILPTVMGLLKMNYENKSAGIDLLRQKRNRVFFTYDSEICTLDSNSFYVDRPVDPHLFLRNEKEADCPRSEDAMKIKQHKEFTAATLQLLEERFYGK